ncbi:MAG: methionyl-tRNA formyltransferase [Planctomycetes bacterium]|nr:methionyl-tRNA formyltransferase [Planctomycetota bacterium]
MNIVFFGTSSCALSSMEAIAGSKHKILLVVTQPDRPSGRCLKNTCTAVKKIAGSINYPVFQPDDINSLESLTELKKCNADIFVVVSYGQILKKSIRELPGHGAVNLHFSLLPKYRGSSPVNFALINGEKQTGVTIFQLDKGVDTGPVLSSAAMDISPEDDACTLFDKLCSAGAELLVKTLDDIEAGRARLTGQEHAQATHARMLAKQDGLVDWASKAVDIHNRIRGLLPWPKAYSFLRMEDKSEPLRVNFISSRIGHDNTQSGMKPGSVISADKDGIAVQCGHGSLVIKKLQPENRPEMDAGAFVNGYKIKKGGSFGKE